MTYKLSIEKMFNLETDVKIVSYQGHPTSHFSENFKEFLHKQLVEPLIKKRDERVTRRIKNCLEQVDRFVKSKKVDALVQIRNKYEGNIIEKYVEENYRMSGIYSVIVKSSELKQKVVKSMTIRLPDSDSECSRSECSCARHHFIVENTEKPVLYVRLIKKSN